MDFTTEQFKDMMITLKELGIVATKHDPASTASTWTAPHGPGGIFSDGSVRPDMYSTVPRVTNNFSGRIPLIQSRMDNEIYEILTGVTATSGTRAVDICSEGPTPGRFKVCRQVIPFGQVKVDTEVNRLSDFGRRIDYQDLDRNVLNFQPSMSPFVPQVGSTDLNDRLGKQFAELGVGIELGVELVDFIGVAGAGSDAAYLNQFITQYAGLESLVKTGHVDSVTSIACPAADSIVTAFNAPIGGNGVNGASFVRTVTDAYVGVRERARIIGMADTQFVIVVNPKLAYEMYYNWACAYATDRCAGGEFTPVNQDGMAITRFRDEMMSGSYLWLHGERIPVLLSTGIPANGVGNNIFNSDLYILPMNWRGRPLLYRQFFPLNNGEAQQFLSMENDARVINGGLYAVGKRSTNGLCTKFEFYSKHRLILDMPSLAARINDIQVTYTINSLDVRVGESLYRDGGTSTRFQ